MLTVAEREDKFKRDIASGMYADKGGMFRGTNFISNAQLQEERAADRELKKLALSNKGNLDVQNRSEVGQTKRTGMREAGSTARAEMQEAGSMARAGMQRDTSMSRLGFDKQVEDTRFLEDAKKFGLDRDKFNLDKLFKERNFTSAQRKSYLERLDKLTTPKLDADGLEVGGSAMPYGAALEQLDFEDRALEERAGRR